MTNEELIVTPVERPAQVIVVQPPIVEVDQGNVELATPTTEQIQASDRLFEQQQQQSQHVANFLGLVTSLQLGRDLFEDHFGRETEEEERAGDAPALPER